MTKPKVTTKAPALGRGQRDPTILAGDRIAAAFAEVYGGIKLKPEAPPHMLESNIDLGWLDRLHHLFAAWICEAVPHEGYNRADALFFCIFAVELLKEHQEVGVSTRDLLLSARKMAARMDVSNTHRYAFVGIVAEGATGDTPKRTRGRAASKVPELIPEVAQQWIHRHMFNESGEMIATKEEAISKTHALMADVLVERLVPTKRKLAEYYSRWVADQPANVPRAHGNAKIRKQPIP